MNKHFIVVLLLIAGVLADSDTCYYEWQKFYAAAQSTNYTSDYWKMFQYSGFTINDLGNYNGCNDISIARYAVIEINESPRVVQTVCGPISCSEEDYYNSSMGFYTYPQFDVIFPRKYQKDHYSEYSGSTVGMLVFGSILAGLVLVATAVELIVGRPDSYKPYFKLLYCYSLKKNLGYVLVPRPKKEDGTEDTLDVLDGARVLLIGWVIIGQTLASYNEYLPLINYANLIHETTETSYMLSYGGFFAADAFYWISGLLITYFFLRKFSDTEITPVNILLEYARRIWRIIPAYFFVMLFMWAMTAHIGNGPMWYYVNDRLNGDCEDYWYSNVFFVNNFIPHGRASYCHSDSWFISTLMQFFLITPFVLIMYLKISKLLGWFILLLLVTIGVTTTVVIADHYDLIITQDTYNADYINNYKNYFYGKPYIRLGAYSIGIACGIILYAYRTKVLTGRTTDYLGEVIGGFWENKYVRYIGATIGFVLNVLLIIYIFKSYRKLRTDDDYSDTGEDMYYLYLGFRRPLFAIGVSLIIMPALLGHFDYLRMFLGHLLFNIFSKFVFAMFLIYYPIIQIVQLSAKDSVELNIYNVLKDGAYFFILAFIFSIPIVFLIELPARNIKDLYFPGEKKHKKRPHKHHDTEKEDKARLMGDQE